MFESLRKFFARPQQTLDIGKVERLVGAMKAIQPDDLTAATKAIELCSAIVQELKPGQLTEDQHVALSSALQKLDGAGYNVFDLRADLARTRSEEQRTASESRVIDENVCIDVHSMGGLFPLDRSVRLRANHQERLREAAKNAGQHPETSLAAVVKLAAAKTTQGRRKIFKAYVRKSSGQALTELEDVCKHGVPSLTQFELGTYTGDTIFRVRRRRRGILAVDRCLARYHEASEADKKTVGDELVLECTKYLFHKKNGSSHKALGVNALKEAILRDQQHRPALSERRALRTPA